MPSIEELLLKLEERFILGEISEKTYLELKAKYEKMVQEGKISSGGGIKLGDTGMIKDSTISSKTNIENREYYGAPALGGNLGINIGGENLHVTKKGFLCPICGSLAKDDYFRCKGCGRPFICNSHKDSRTYLCEDCERERAKEERARAEADQQYREAERRKEELKKLEELERQRQEAARLRAEEDRQRQQQVLDLRNKAKHEMGKENYEGAMGLLQNLLRLDPSHPEGMNLLTQAIAGKAIKEEEARKREAERKRQEEERIRREEEKRSLNDPVTGMEFVFIKGGTFQMGDTFGDGDSDEKPVHQVTVSDFCLGKYPVTQGQWQAVMGNNPSHFKKGDNYPVEEVSWEDAREFIWKLNQQTGKNYRLPTEAEWEYGARSGGKKEKWAGTSKESELVAYAWYESNSGNQTHPVGQKKPNGLGLYDMSGNVWEWCQDWYGSYPAGPLTDPEGPLSGSDRVVRGGAWDGLPCYVRSASRDGGAPSGRDDFIGFRLVRTSK